MDTEFLGAVGQTAGIGGVAIGVLLLLFRDVVRKQIFPNLTRVQAFRLLSMIVLLIWSAAITGIVAPIWTERVPIETAVGEGEGDSIETRDCSPVTDNTSGNVTISIDCEK